MQVLVLGPLEMTVGSSPAVIRGGRPRSLVHSLLLNRRVVQPVEVLVDRLWERDAPVDAPNAVHQLVSYLRRALGPEGRDVLQTTATGYRLDVPDEAVDAWRMERLLQAALAGIQAVDGRLFEGALADATGAVRLWRGEPFTESAHLEWTAGDRARLQDVYLQAQETRIDAMLALGQHREAVLETQSLSAAYPLRERFHAQLSLALYRTGRQSEALDTHRSVRELLARELGLDPGSELRDLEQAILTQDPALDWRAPTDAVNVDDDLLLPGTSTTLRRVAAPEPHRIRVPAPPIIGREDDTRLACERIAPGVVYTLTGPAGVGKTRLALSLSHKLASPTWFVDLDGLTDDADVASTVGMKLALPNEPGRESTQTVVEALTDADGLLVLDNCESVVAGVSELADQLRVCAPQLALLVTSRRPLGLVGEMVHRLTPLLVPAEDARHPIDIESSPAVRLWLDRAATVGATAGLDRQQLRDVAAIVRLVDGLPMAIEIAAGHADVSTTRMIRGRLEARLDSLVASPASTHARASSLTAAIEASVVLLSREERDFLYSLSVFPGPFEVRSAAFVAGASDDETYRLLASLVRQSLVTLDAAGYRLLAPVRSFSATRAAAVLDVEALRQRHARWLSEVAWRSWRQTGGLRHTQQLGELTPLMADARVALGWALAARDLTTASRLAVGFAWVWTLHGRTDEGFTWLSRVRALSDEAPLDGREAAVARASVLRSLGLLANPRGQLTLASEVCSEASELALRCGDDEGAAAALLTLAVSQWALGRFDESAAAADQATGLLATRPDSWYYVTSRVLRARTALDAAEDTSPRLLDEAVDVAQAAGDSHMLGLALACRARQFLLDDAPAAAGMAAEEALRIWRGIDYTEGEMMALNVMARAAGTDRNTARATELATDALRTAVRTGHRGASCEAVESLALAAAGDGRREQALMLFAMSARERARLKAPVPAADDRFLEPVRAMVREALGDAVSLVEARARITRWDDFVEELACRPSSVEATAG